MMVWVRLARSRTYVRWRVCTSSAWALLTVLECRWMRASLREPMRKTGRLRTIGSAPACSPLGISAGPDMPAGRGRAPVVALLPTLSLLLLLEVLASDGTAIESRHPKNREVLLPRADRAVI